jgi:solute carrier family 25 protein 39/40
VVTNPLDVVKTRRQIELGERGFRNGGWGAGLKIVRELREASGGWRWVWIGLGPRLAKVIPACAIMIASYDCCKAALRHR